MFVLLLNKDIRLTFSSARMGAVLLGVLFSGVYVVILFVSDEHQSIQYLLLLACSLWGGEQHASDKTCAIGS